MRFEYICDFEDLKRCAFFVKRKSGVTRDGVEGRKA